MADSARLSEARLGPGGSFPACRRLYPLVVAIDLYGYYGRIEAGALRSSPADFIHPDAPPILITHGDQDTFVPPEHARELVDRLRATSTSPVISAELPGSQHSFDHASSRAPLTTC